MDRTTKAMIFRWALILSVPLCEGLACPALAQTGETAKPLYWYYVCTSRENVAGGQLEIRTNLHDDGRFQQQEVDWNGPINAAYGSASAFLFWRHADSARGLANGTVYLDVAPSKRAPHYSQWWIEGREGGSGYSADVDRSYPSNKDSVRVRLNYGDLRKFTSDWPKAKWILRTYPNSSGDWRMLMSGYLEQSFFREIELNIARLNSELDALGPEYRSVCTRTPYYEDPNGQI